MKHPVIAVTLATGLLCSLYLLSGKFSGARMVGNQQGYEPAQPIAFSHRLHAGELKIPCLYCHANAEQSRHAGIPSGNICMNCHAQVMSSFGAVRQEDEAARLEKRSPKAIVSAELAKLFAAVGVDPASPLDKQAVQSNVAWERIHKLPDFAYFDHRAHVGAGVRCQQCHGPVETMEVMRQHASLSMGWCVNCHRESNRKGVAGRPVKASLDCATCHY